ncbi:MAG TPA: glycosyltransferase family 4 protein [Longimicrobium sp.]|nr:glycosyltransferase family 4 protein [Longimicrobium sp.]
MSRPRRLLTLGHSYVVGTNRRLAQAMARVGTGEWEVTAAAPAAFPGDLGPIALQPAADERVVPVSVHGAGRIHTMRYGPELRELLRQEWDVVHCWEEPFIVAGAQVAAWAPRNAKLVYATFQNLPKRYPPPFSWMERYAMRRADGWIAFGRLVESVLGMRTMYARRPHRVIAPGVDTTLFRPNREAGRRTQVWLGWEDEDPPVVGYLGRFVPEKGIETLMRALDACSQPWRAFFVGGGQMLPEVRAWADRYGDRVRIATDVAHDAVPAFVNAMDLLCAPSRTTRRWHEQLGRMLTEAMACGVPVAGSSSGEIPFVLGDAGVIVPEDDVAAWTRALDTLLADRSRRADLAARGRARAEAEFALDVVARQHLDFFSDLLA